MMTNVPEVIVKNPLTGPPPSALPDAPPPVAVPSARRVNGRDAKPTTPTGIGQRLRMLGYRAMCYALSHLLPLKIGFAALRRLRPLAMFGSVMVVTKAEDVREVLARFDDFTLGEFIEPGMPWGPFIMTIDWREQHALERALLESVVNPAADMRTIRALVADEARRQIDVAKAAGRIDAVARIAEPVAVRVAAEYFGVPAIGGSALRMADAMADLAGIIMVNPPVNSPPFVSSRESIEQVTNAVLAQLYDAKAAIGRGELASLPDTLLTRLARLHSEGKQPSWFDDDWIRRYLTGLIGTGGATIVRATAHTLDQILAHPEGLKLAQDAAARLAQAPDDPAITAELRQLLYEALRFRPMLPLLIRDCPRDTVIASGTKRARIVPGGTHVLASPLAAMFDPEAVEEPWQFRAGRPAEAYLLFGHGVRSCFGRYIADIAIFEILFALLRCPGLARAPGAEGQVRYGGPAARGLTVTFQQRSMAEA